MATEKKKREDQLKKQGGMNKLSSTDKYGNSMKLTNEFNRRADSIRSQRGFNPSLRTASNSNSLGGAAFATDAAKRASVPPKQGLTLSGQDIRDRPGGVTGPNDPVGAGGGGGSSGIGRGGKQRFAANPSNRAGIKGGKLRGTAAKYTGALRERRKNKLEGLQAPQGGMVNPTKTLSQQTMQTGPDVRKVRLEHQAQNALGRILKNISGGKMSDFDTKHWAQLLGIGM